MALRRRQAANSMKPFISQDVVLFATKLTTSHDRQKMGEVGWEEIPLYSPVFRESHGHSLWRAAECWHTLELWHWQGSAAVLEKERILAKARIQQFSQRIAQGNSTTSEKPFWNTLSFISDTRPWSIFKCFSHQFWVDFFEHESKALLPMLLLKWLNNISIVCLCMRMTETVWLNMSKKMV